MNVARPAVSSIRIRPSSRQHHWIRSWRFDRQLSPQIANSSVSPIELNLTEGDHVRSICERRTRMLPYTAGDGLQIIAREYGIIINQAKETEADAPSGLRALW